VSFKTEFLNVCQLGEVVVRQLCTTSSQKKSILGMLRLSNETENRLYEILGMVISAQMRDKQDAMLQIAAAKLSFDELFPEKTEEKRAIAINLCKRISDVKTTFETAPFDEKVFLIEYLKEGHKGFMGFLLRYLKSACEFEITNVQAALDKRRENEQRQEEERRRAEEEEDAEKERRELERLKEEEDRLLHPLMYWRVYFSSVPVDAVDNVVTTLGEVLKADISVSLRPVLCAKILRDSSLMVRTREDYLRKLKNRPALWRIDVCWEWLGENGVFDMTTKYKD